MEDNMEVSAVGQDLGAKEAVRQPGAVEEEGLTVSSKRIRNAAAGFREQGEEGGVEIRQGNVKLITGSGKNLPSHAGQIGHRTPPL
jgi:hypothetical protein